MIEIYVENYRIDGSSGISPLLTFAIDDITDFASRNTTFSKTIVIPGTANNNKIFGHVFELGSSNAYNDSLPNVNYNFNASKSARCIIFQDNIQMFKGVLRLLEIVVDGAVEYECAVFGELTGFSSALANKKLEDLDFSAYNHTFNITNIQASWDSINGSGYFYPLIDYGQLSSSKHDWDVRAFRPALYAKEYIDKIFAGINFTYESNLFNSARFKSIGIPNNAKALYTTPTQLITAARTSSFSFTPDFENLTWDSYTIDTAFSHSAGVFTYNSATPLGVRTRGTIAGTYDIADHADEIVITISSGNGGQDFSLQNPGAGTPPFAFSFDFDFVSSINITQNVRVQLSSTNTTGIILTVDSCTLNVAPSIITPIELPYGGAVKINETIPKGYLQKDFITWIVKLFNLYIYEDRFDENHLIIEPYVDYYSSDSSNAVDWSLKVDRGKPFKIKPMSELNSRFYDFKFKQDSDYYNELYRKLYNQGYGDRIYDSEFEFSKEKETIEVGFSATPLVGYAGEDKIYSTIFKKTNDIEEKIDSNIRLMIVKKITGVASWDVKDGVTVLSSITNYGYAGHFDDPDAPTNDLNFGATKELYFTLVSGNISANQFNLYWSSYMAEISDKDSRLLNVKVRLRNIDISNLDFSKYVNIDGVLYRLNKIDNYNVAEDDTCDVTLLKVINTEY